MKLTDLKVNPDNPRTIKDARFKKLCNSIRDFPKMMAIRPIVIDKANDNLILGGNMRYNALKALKFTEIPDEWVRDAAELTADEKKRFIIEDNMPFGEWDMDILANSFDTSDLVEWGFDEKELGISPGDPQDAEPQIDRAEELNKKWQVKTGDLWQVGEHRLLAGDSTKGEDVTRMMRGEKAESLIADPPYGMRLDADFSGMVNNLQMAKEKGLKSGRKYNNVIGDDKDFDARPVIEAIGNPSIQFWFGADYYSSTLPDPEHSGAWLVWDKRLDESADKMFGSCFELIWARQKCKRDIIRIKWAGVFGTEKEPQRGRQHPNQKPVELLVNLAERTEGIVIDPFLGSGTTMVACQNLNRKCRGIEISPPYVAVCLQRMTDAFPGIEIRRIE